MKEEIQEERRAGLRIPFRIPMRYRKIESTTKEFKGSLMRDISKGGARMTIFEFLPLNLSLATEIPLARGVRPVKSTGRVAWVTKAAYSDQYDVGIEFTGLETEDLVQINELIGSQRKNRYRR